MVKVMPKKPSENYKQMIWISIDPAETGSLSHNELFLYVELGGRNKDFSRFGGGKK